MKCLIVAVFGMTLLTDACFAMESPVPTTDPFFKEPTERSIVLQTLDGKRVKAVISHKDALELKLKAGTKFELFSIEPYRKIWKNTRQRP